MTATQSSSETVHIIGAGLAGSEAAWQVAEHGVPTFIDVKRVNVNHAAARVGHHDVPAGAVAGIPAGLEHRAQSREVALVDGKIEICMLARLLAEQGIDAPTPVDPDDDPRAVEHAAKRDDLAKFHVRRRRSGYFVGVAQASMTARASLRTSV